MVALVTPVVYLADIGEFLHQKGRQACFVIMCMIWLSRVVLRDEAGVIRHPLIRKTQLECLIVDFDMHFQFQADVIGVILAQAQDGAQRLFHRCVHACLC